MSTAKAFVHVLLDGWVRNECKLVGMLSDGRLFELINVSVASVVGGVRAAFDSVLCT